MLGPGDDFAEIQGRVEERRPSQGILDVYEVKH